MKGARRTTRDAVMGVLVEPHITAAVARGETAGHIVRHHVLRNAGSPILTLLGTITAYLLGGAVIIETLFNLPGLGSLLIDSLSMRDYPMVSGVNLIFASFILFINLLIDLLYAYLDPRIRYQ